MKATQLDQWRPDQHLDEVGSSRSRLEAHQKVTGSARYSSDVHLPGQLHAAVVRSPHPRARVTAVDTAPALQVPGVVDVLTADDVRDVRWYEEEAPLFGDVVRFVGDEVAAVAALTVEAARRGAAAVHVDYDVLDHVTDGEHALDGDAATVHEGGNLAAEPQESGRGDVDTAMAGADEVVDLWFRTPTAVHNALEPHGSTAWWQDDQLTLYCSTQGVNDVRDIIAERLALDHNHIRVVAEHVGGGFGAKQVPWKPTAIAALLSRKTGRPVQLMLDRRAENLAAGKRNGTWQHVRLGAGRDGRLVAIDADLWADNGAYSVAGEASNVPGAYLQLYACDNVRTVYRRVYTDTGPAVAFRAPGYVEAAFALESAMDELARRLGIDPVELRRRNYTERDQQKDLPLSSPDALRTCYDRVIEVAGRAEAPDGDTAGVVRGRGFAAHEWMAGKASPAGVRVDRAELGRHRPRGDVGPGHRHGHPHVAHPGGLRGAGHRRRSHPLHPGRHRRRSSGPHQFGQRHHPHHGPRGAGCRPGRARPGDRPRRRDPGHRPGRAALRRHHHHVRCSSASTTWPSPICSTSSPRWASTATAGWSTHPTTSASAPSGPPSPTSRSTPAPGRSA